MDLVILVVTKTYTLAIIFVYSILMSLPLARDWSLVMIMANKSSRLSSRSANTPALKKILIKRKEVDFQVVF